MRFNLAFFAVLLSFFTPICKAQSIQDSIVIFSGQEIKPLIFGEKAFIFKDESNRLDIYDVAKEGVFEKSDLPIPNLGVSEATFWIKFQLRNNSSQERLMLEIENALLKEVVFYDEAFHPTMITKEADFSHRNNQGQTPQFALSLSPGAVATYYLSIRSDAQISVPLKLGTPSVIYNANLDRDFFSALYFGIMLVIFFYNLFIFASVKDRSYFYYILYVLSVAFVQLSITGIGFKYLWPYSPGFEEVSVYLFSALTAFSSIAFFRRFLHVRQFTPRANLVFWVFIGAYIFTLFQAFWGSKHLAYNLLNLNALPLALFMLGLAAYIRVKYKYRPAFFFLIAWSVFLGGIIVFVLKDFGALPYNIFTFSSVQIGSAIETILLSIALADRINVLKDESRISQAQALEAAKENERIIKEQNIFLEAKVNERTLELQASNDELAQTLNELQETQTQLIESEKMASLGQLTAGIAHEINNPINFVTSNVSPLKRDIEALISIVDKLDEFSLNNKSDEVLHQRITQLKNETDYDYLKTEINFLIKGIHEGASRTAEIVKGLRVFSRLDEDDLKRADINEGIDSTLSIVNHLLNENIEIEKRFSGIPLIECYPGKLNQVFLNMMSNAVHAINARWNGNKGGKLTLASWNDETYVYVSVKDNGVGMDEEVKKRIYDPFFTTKDVGEGTGLGLSIAYNTIKKHNGFIETVSEFGVGSEFIIVIPQNQSN